MTNPEFNSYEQGDSNSERTGWEDVAALADNWSPTNQNEEGSEIIMEKTTDISQEGESSEEKETMNTEPFFGEVYKTYLMRVFRLYEKIEQSDIPLEEKVGTFSTELGKFLDMDKKDMDSRLRAQTNDQRILNLAPTELHRGAESLNYETVKNLYDTFINDVNLVGDDYEGNMYITVPKDQKIFDERLLDDDGEVLINPNIEYDFSMLKETYDFAKEHDKQVKFHVFLYHAAIPDNLKEEIDNVDDPALKRKMALAFLNDYAAKLAGFMKEGGYDLRQLEALNEIAHDDTPEPGVVRDTWWKNIIENDSEKCDPYYIDVLKIVRKNFPNTEIIYNEYNEFIDWKADRIVNILETIKKYEDDHPDEGRLLDGIGLQAHYTDFIKGPNIPLKEEAIRRNAEKLQRACGDKKIYITEYDFVDTLHDGSKERLEKAFIEIYSKISNGFITWGNSDALTWYNCTDKNGKSMNAEIVDTDGKPKEVYKKIRDAFYLSKEQ